METLKLQRIIQNIVRAVLYNEAQVLTVLSF